MTLLLPCGRIIGEQQCYWRCVKGGSSNDGCVPPPPPRLPAVARPLTSTPTCPASPPAPSPSASPPLPAAGSSPAAREPSVGGNSRHKDDFRRTPPPVRKRCGWLWSGVRMDVRGGVRPAPPACSPSRSRSGPACPGRRCQGGRCSRAAGGSPSLPARACRRRRRSPRTRGGGTRRTSRWAGASPRSRPAPQGSRKTGRAAPGCRRRCAFSAGKAGRPGGGPVSSTAAVNRRAREGELEGKL